jgi:hypothetical protein
MGNGKKWSSISKVLGERRSEHAVKNRYKSMLTRYYNNTNKNRRQWNLSEKDILHIL